MNDEDEAAPEKPAKGKKATGRPARLSEELIEKIARAVKMGQRIPVALQLYVPRPTGYLWLATGRKAADAIARNAERKKGGKRYGEELEKLKPHERLAATLIDRISQAIAQAEARDVSAVDRGANLDWRAAAFKLKHRHPDVYGERHRLEITGEDGGPIAVTDAIEEAMERARELKRRRREERQGPVDVETTNEGPREEDEDDEPVD